MEEFDNKTIDIVNALFEKIVRVKPAFKQAWPSDYEFQMVKREWVRSFIRNNISSLNQIKRGLERLIDAPSAFIPSPGEFIALCNARPEDIGAPDLETAYNEAIKNARPDGTEKKWSHPAVKYAAHASDMFSLRTKSRNEIFPIFKSRYFDALNQCTTNRNLNQIENGKKDTIENRIKYQEYYGEINLKYKYSNTICHDEILSYEQWLEK